MYGDTKMTLKGWLISAAAARRCCFAAIPAESRRPRDC